MQCVVLVGTHCSFAVLRRKCVKYRQKLLSGEPIGIFRCYYCMQRKTPNFEMETTNINEKLLSMEPELFLYARLLTKDNCCARRLLQAAILRILLFHNYFLSDDKLLCVAKGVIYNLFLNGFDVEQDTISTGYCNLFCPGMMYMPGRNDVVDNYKGVYLVPYV